MQVKIHNNFICFILNYLQNFVILTVMCNVQCAMYNVQCAMRIQLYALRLEQLSLYDGLASCIEKKRVLQKVIH